MKYHWIQQKYNPNLIVVFNGWGMDHHPFRDIHCDPQDDVVMFYDYRELALDDEVARQCRQYEHVNVLAWSMGVWAYAQLREQFPAHVERAVAVNGTCQPIHDRHGISPQVYQATLSHFSEQGREKFFKRMCTSRELFRRFHESLPQRSLTEQKEELFAIQQAAAQQHPAAPCYTHAIIGKKDRIIPTQHQQHFWEQQHAPYTLIDAPHFPFFGWKSWRAILDHATEHS